MNRKKIGLIFPHQLFKSHPILEHVDTCVLVEDSLFFGDIYHPLNFHKQKLIFHRASMKAYASFLEKKGYRVSYIAYDKKKTILDVARQWAEDEVFVVDPTDFLLEKRLRNTLPHITILPTPLFINTREENEMYLAGRKTYFMHHFYQWQRKRLDILVDKDNKPTGGKWSFDSENRLKLPKREYENIPSEPSPQSSEYIDEAKKYILKNFPNNPGDIDHFWYPINHVQAEQWLDDFFKKRFDQFGPYEDAITREHHVLYHSLLSPLLNVGLLDPKYVVEKACIYANQQGTPINSLEGFIRQIIGWREYMRMVYEKEGVTMRTANTWNHVQSLSKKFYTGTTGIDPVDHTIHKILNTAYAHHIERLMVLGNFMFLSGIDPRGVYKWFMELFIDAYDWVMVPNVYAMSQNSVHGLITTKPYISGSNYILKMSDYTRGDWCDIWDALYWDFVIQNIETLRKNDRMHFVVRMAEKFTKEQGTEYHRKATAFRQSLDLG